MRAQNMILKCACAVMKMAWPADIPSTAFLSASMLGYYYDPKTKRYFRSPPQHLAYMVTDFKATPRTSRPRDGPRYDKTYDQVPTSFFNLVCQTSRSLHPPNMLTITETSICSSKCHPMEGFFDRGKVVANLRLNTKGDMVAAYILEPLGLNPVSFLYLYELGFSKPRKEIKLLPFYFRSFHPQYMLGSPVGICGDGESEVVVCYEKVRKRGCVIARTCKSGTSDGVDEDLFTRNWHTTDEHVDSAHAMWTVPVREDSCSADALSCTTSTSNGVLGALSTTKGMVHVLGLLNMHSLVEIGKRQTPDKRSVLSLEFSKSHAVLYAGTRSGKVMLWDLRSSSNTCSMIHIKRSGRLNPSVIQLHTLNDNYLVTNSMSSELLLWDCRMNRQVISYPGHTNSYRTCQSAIDRTQSIVAAVSEDKTIRIWSVWSGKLLRCIPDTEYVIGDYEIDDCKLPAIAFSNFDEWAGGLPILLVATHNGITHFSI